MRPALRRRLWIASLGLPLGLLLIAALVARPEPASGLVPVLGPWAGLAYGHSDCTIGNLAPGFSIALLVAGLGMQAAFACVARSRAAGSLAVYSLAALSGAWASAWAATAILSLGNASI